MGETMVGLLLLLVDDQRWLRQVGALFMFGDVADLYP